MTTASWEANALCEADCQVATVLYESNSAGQLDRADVGQKCLIYTRQTTSNSVLHTTADSNTGKSLASVVRVRQHTH